MTDVQWPYNLPIWRSAYKAASPDGRFVAEIGRASEVSMGNPTAGTLRLPGHLELERCNPSFMWSSDSIYLTVPQFFHRFGLFRRQRLLVVDVRKRLVFASREITFYFQPESFDKGRLVAIKNPFRSPEQAVWQIPGDIGRFSPVAAKWTAA